MSIPLNSRPMMALLTAVLMAGYAVVVMSALLAAPIVFAAAIVATTALDLLIERHAKPLVDLLRRAQFGISHRVFVQIFMLLLLVAVTNGVRGSSRVELAFVTAAALMLPLARVSYLGLLTMVRRRVQRPVEVRNVELPAALTTSPLPRILDRHAASRLLVLGGVPIVVGALCVQYGTFWPFVLTAGAYALLVAAASAVLVKLLVRDVRGTSRRLLEVVNAAVADYRPEVVLYFSGSAKATYQVDTWLQTLAQTGRRCLVLLRERHTFWSLAKTDLPVVCLPSSVDLMNFVLPDVRVALYVANVGKNIHFLREPRIKHVFIGHGDSDKVGSFNPFSKVYDEIWVAGAAGRERYARARVGVRDDAIVEVGRPQLDALARRDDSPTEAPLTVFYAPTWEGWTDEGFQTSLTEMGAPIVRQLLASEPAVRVIYKPHPLTGTRDPRAAAADAEVRDLLAAAAASAPAPEASVRTRLEQVARRLDRTDLSVDETRALEREWVELYWRAHAGQHLTIDDPRLSLYDCFDVSDVLIADVSGVVSDFVATAKPYIVANPKAVPDEAFREAFPTVRGGYVLDAACTRLGDIMAAIDGPDPLADERDRVRHHLLGPDEPPAIERWNAAVERLIGIAEAEWGDEHGTGRPGDDAPDDVEVAELRHTTEAETGLSDTASGDEDAPPPPAGESSDEDAEPRQDAGSVQR